MSKSGDDFEARLQQARDMRSKGELESLPLNDGLELAGGGEATIEHLNYQKTVQTKYRG